MFHSIRFAIAVLCIVSFASEAVFAATPEKPVVSVRDLIDFKRLRGGLKISPDGAAVAYIVAEPDVAQNALHHVVYVARLADNPFDPHPVIRTHASGNLKWSADSRNLFVLHQPAEEARPIISRLDTRSGEVLQVFRSAMVIEHFELADDGSHVLATGYVPPNPKPDPRGVVISPGDQRPAATALRLHRNAPREIRALSDDGERFIRYEDPGRKFEKVEPEVDRQGDIEVGILASTQRAPDLYLSVAGKGTRRILTDLNPFLKTRKLGKVELLEWSVGKKNYWGHIVYPANFEAGRRYPCAILAKSWKREGFYFESQSTYPFGNFPVQALAGADLLVLMLARGDIPHGDMDTIDASGSREGYHSAREQLAKRGLVDPSRCGLMGFSHTGWQVDYLISHPGQDAPWATAIAADHYTRDNPMSHFLGPWIPQIGVITPAQAAQFRTVDDVRAVYLGRSAAWSASSIRTPLLEVFQGEIDNIAEIFNAMTDRGKPVELVWMPDAPHTLEKPVQREAAMQRVVDWFRFWLQDYERSSVPEDPDRYVRWRKLLELHRQNERWIEQRKDPNQEWWKLTRPEKFSTPGAP